MTPYRPEDLAENWEFKILRAPTGIFRNPETLRAILEEEARGGWILVEKFDDTRIRLKRRPSAKKTLDEIPDGYDPYRSTVGTAGSAIVVMALVGLGLALVLLFGGLAALASR
jgi:hypothetical protein